MWILSLAEFVRSLSCHKGIFSIATANKERRIRAKEDTLSLLIGFLFTGTALLPICPFETVLLPLQFRFFVDYEFLPLFEQYNLLTKLRIVIGKPLPGNDLGLAVFNRIQAQSLRHFFLNFNCLGSHEGPSADDTKSFAHKKSFLTLLQYD